MLNQIKLFLEHHLALPAPDANIAEQLKLASIALLLEMKEIDERGAAQEDALILSQVQKSFGLSLAEAEILLAEAEQHRKQATDYFQFTSLINKNCSLEQKIQFIEALWRVAFADGILDMHEEYLVRKIADLLYVPHLDFIKMKNRVLAGNG